MTAAEARVIGFEHMKLFPADVNCRMGEMFVFINLRRSKTCELIGMVVA